MRKINYKVSGTKPPFIVELLQGGALVTSKEHAASGEGEEYSFTGVVDNLYMLRITDSIGCTHMAEVNMLPDWKPTGFKECVKADDKNTGEVLIEERNMNPYSSTHNALQKVSGGVDLATCPINMSEVNIFLEDYVNNASTVTCTLVFNVSPAWATELTVQLNIFNTQTGNTATEMHTIPAEQQEHRIPLNFDKASEELVTLNYEVISDFATYKPGADYTLAIVIPGQGQ